MNRSTQNEVKTVHLAVISCGYEPVS